MISSREVLSPMITAINAMMVLTAVALQPCPATADDFKVTQMFTAITSPEGTKGFKDSVTVTNQDAFKIFVDVSPPTTTKGTDEGPDDTLANVELTLNTCNRVIDAKGPTGSCSFTINFDTFDGNPNGDIVVGPDSNTLTIKSAILATNPANPTQKLTGPDAATVDVTVTDPSNVPEPSTLLLLGTGLLLGGLKGRKIVQRQIRAAK